ncbi:hypothetical protein ABPG72_017328 [Tetrahymena utriculariae]
MKQMKRFTCKCGKSYDRNSSLFNHIKLKHYNNKQEYNTSQVIVGRPQGQRNYRQNQNKSPSKTLLCKCGRSLKGEGSLSNHIRIKHPNDPYYQIERRQQGRRRRQSFQNNSNTFLTTQVSQEEDYWSTNQNTEQLQFWFQPNDEANFQTEGFLSINENYGKEDDFAYGYWNDYLPFDNSSINNFGYDFHHQQNQQST